MVLARDCALDRLRSYTSGSRSAKQQDAAYGAGNYFTKKNDELEKHNPLIGECNSIATIVKGALAAVTINGSVIEGESCTAFDDRKTLLTNSYYKINAQGHGVVRDGASGPKFAGIMASKEVDLDNDWGRELVQGIDRKV
jgi:hypothetical protein